MVALIAAWFSKRKLPGPDQDNFSGKIQVVSIAQRACRRTGMDGTKSGKWYYEFSSIRLISLLAT